MISYPKATSWKSPFLSATKRLVRRAPYPINEALMPGAEMVYFSKGDNDWTMNGSSNETSRKDTEEIIVERRCRRRIREIAMLRHKRAKAMGKTTEGS